MIDKRKEKKPTIEKVIGEKFMRISKSISSAQPKLGERLPGRARDGSSAGPIARFHGGSHEPEEAQGQVLPGLKPEFGDASANVTT
ncbi:unnamed protein product [Prunus armeniaca]